MESHELVESSDEFIKARCQVGEVFEIDFGVPMTILTGTADGSVYPGTPAPGRESFCLIHPMRYTEFYLA